MTSDEALDYVQRHGVVLASAKGPVPRLTEAIAGGPIKGSWWAHDEGKHIFRVLQAVGDSPEVLVCRLVDGKISYVHRRLWPALVRLTPRFPPASLARVKQVHTAAGHHENQEVAYPLWVPAEVLELSKKLGEDEAERALGEWASLVRNRT